MYSLTEFINSKTTNLQPKFQLTKLKPNASVFIHCVWKNGTNNVLGITLTNIKHIVVHRMSLS